MRRCIKPTSCRDMSTRCGLLRLPHRVPGPSSGHQAPKTPRTAAPRTAGAKETKEAAQPLFQSLSQAPVQGSSSHARFSLVSPAWEPLVGVSKQQQKLEQQVSKAAASHSPVFISGDAGLDTLKIATAVHTLGLGEEDADRPLVLVDCSTPSGSHQALRLLSGLDDLTSPADSASGTNVHILLEHLPQGTLVLNNLHKAPIEVLSLVDAAVPFLLQPKSAPAHSSASCSQPPPATPAEDDSGWLSGTSTPGELLQTLGTRLILISQTPLTQLLQRFEQPDTFASASWQLGEPPNPEHAPSKATSNACQGFSRCASITVPPLRARASDIVPLALRVAGADANLRGYGSVSLTDAAAKKLTGYHFPGNESELAGLVQRAVMLHPAVSISNSSFGSCSSIDGCIKGISQSNGTGHGCSGKCKDSTTSSSSSNTICCGNCSTASIGPELVLDEQDFWAATQDADRTRMDVLELFPWLKSYLLNFGVWPHGLNNITKWLYPLIVASLFLGPQDREHSAALTVFWAGWWPLVMLSFPFVGRAWCSICPFMLTGEQAQDLVQDTAGNPSGPKTAATTADRDPLSSPALSNPPGRHSNPGDALTKVLKHQWLKFERLMPQDWRWKLKSWPADVAQYGSWFIVAGFAGILMWEEVWDLPNTAALSGWLLMLITAGAVACSVVFEKRLWCKELCPIGAMNGLFAKMSMTEIRSRSGLCAAAACGRPCHKGKVVPETATLLPGCPMNMHPGANIDNHDCIMCGNCLRSCGTGSAQWRLRPPAADLWGDHTATVHEVTLMYVLLGAVLLHRLPELCDQLGLPADDLLTQQGPHLLLSALLLAAPGAAAWAWNKAGTAITRHFKSRTAAATADPTAAVVAGPLLHNSSSSPAGESKVADSCNVAALAGSDLSSSSSSLAGESKVSEISYTKLAYSMLPLVWAGMLAHYEDLLLSELGLLLPRLATSLGVDETASWLALLPTLGPAPAAVVSAAQGVTLVAGVALSWALAGKIAEVQVGREQAGEATAVQRALILAIAAELWHLIV